MEGKEAGKISFPFVREKKKKDGGKQDHEPA